MVVVLMGALFAVRESAPSDVRLEASSADGSSLHGLDAATADRLAHAVPIRASRSEGQARTFVRANDEATTTTLPPTTTAAPATTTTTARPKVVVTTTTTAKPKPTTTTTAKPKPTTTTTAAPTTTTTAKPTTTSTMGPPPPCCRQDGGASYYDYSDPRMCAHKSLPKGTVLTVTNLANGKQTTCVVGDRGPYVQGRILDLSKTAFTEIASLSDGVIQVSIQWTE